MRGVVAGMILTCKSIPSIVGSFINHTIIFNKVFRVLLLIIKISVCWSHPTHCLLHLSFIHFRKLTKFVLSKTSLIEMGNSFIIIWRTYLMLDLLNNRILFIHMVTFHWLNNIGWRYRSIIWYWRSSSTIHFLNF